MRFVLLAGLLAGLHRPTAAVKCYCTDDHCVPYGSCDGTVCLVGILRDSNQVIRTCGNNPLGCHRDEGDKWTDLCACNLPFCNTFAYLRSHTRRKASVEWPESQDSSEQASAPAVQPHQRLAAGADVHHDAPLVFHRMDRPDDQPPPPQPPVSTQTSLLTLLLVGVPLVVGAATVVVVAFNYYCHLC